MNFDIITQIKPKEGTYNTITIDYNYFYWHKNYAIEMNNLYTNKMIYIKGVNIFDFFVFFHLF